MSDFVPFKTGNDNRQFVRDFVSGVAEVELSPTGPTKVTLEDGKMGHGVCLGCANPPCFKKESGELDMAGSLAEFPGDPSMDVCPTKAIGWDGDSRKVQIDSEHCIGCGLCVVRCPYGAIRLSAEAIAEVSQNDIDGITDEGEVKRPHAKPKRTGLIGEIPGKAISDIPNSVGELPSAVRNVLVRNLMHEAGMNARVRRHGDMNMRIDAVGYTASGRSIVADIELAGEPLESPRAILENIAVMHSRYGFAFNELDALCILMALPNQRSEFYQVMCDIENVLTITCRVITIGALQALVWSGKTIEGFKDGEFVVQENSVDLGKSLPLQLQEPYPGAFTPAK